MSKLPRLLGTEETGPQDPEEEKMMECPTCEGKGEVTVYWKVSSGTATADGIQTLEHKMHAQAECPTCHGTGLVPDDREPAPEFDTLREKEEA
jgi:DnaJ-class molecular chaperone